VYCEDYVGYFTIILPFLAFYFYSAYFIYMVSCNVQERTNKTLTTGPLENTYEVDEVSPEVEVGVIVGIRCLQP
jgi:hypothetical protein